ncbi:hypothetical protein [Helicobacter pylori]|uniref:hypothetical protein n=1 Tax=Helicobacter pylori TaxID=210 RepID=UPI000B086444|nr:hypothetical protein [Helicobacter pylori]WRC83588.1 hypothetical protein E5K89_02280 [Helicobacter pylori]
MEFFHLSRRDLFDQQGFYRSQFSTRFKKTLEQQDKEFSLSGIKELKEKCLYPSDKNNCNINN